MQKALINAGAILRSKHYTYDGIPTSKDFQRDETTGKKILGKELKDSLP
jgi:hypothetical protein